MKYQLIDTPETLARASRVLAGVSRISLDCEAAGFHRYSDRLCLVQLSTPRENLILDPLSLDLAPVLKPFLEDPEVQVVMHGAEVIGVDIPLFVELEVVETEPGVKGDTVSGSGKPAKLETGAVVQVPFFVNVGDKIKVDTRTDAYIERVK